MFNSSLRSEDGSPEENGYFPMIVKHLLFESGSNFQVKQKHVKLRGGVMGHKKSASGCFKSRLFLRCFCWGLKL